MKVLVTGAAGFIGSHLASRLLDEGHEVVGVDSLTDYYSVQLKRDRLARLEEREGFSFRQLELAERPGVEALFAEHAFDRVAHLAAQPGVRYSLEHPRAYLKANVDAFFEVLEASRIAGVEHFVYASSSSVYGLNGRMPLATSDNVDHPASLYAATKRADEGLAHVYAHLHGLPCTGLRFFTVYGPWGRPDMAPELFCRAVAEGRPVRLFNRGDVHRDFTFIDDIVEGVRRVLDAVPGPDPDWNPSAPDPDSSSAPWRIYNIGRGESVDVRRFLALIEEALGREAIVEEVEMQPGDVHRTWADTSRLERITGYRPAVPIEEGVPRFVAWFREYYGIG